MKLKNLFFAVASVALLTACDKEVAVTGISIDPTAVTFNEIGQKDTLTATLAPADAKADVVWTSSNTAVVTVEGDGMNAIITAVGNGTAKISATADIFTTECSVTVNVQGTGGGDGDGKEATPYTVDQAIANQGGLKWVTGYIVGYINGISIANAAFNVPTDTIQTEILIAASATEKAVDKCLVVQLPTGAVRTGLDLYTNPSNLGKTVKLYGSLEAYFGKPGMKSTSYYELQGGTTGGTKPVDTSNAVLNETFATGQGAFTIVDVVKPAELTYVWSYNSSYKQMAAGAYKNSTNYATESWLISPAINLSSLSKATLTFEHAGKQFGAPVTNLTIQVSKTYTSGNIVATDWTAVTIPNHLAGETNTFKSSGDIDLTAFCGTGNNNVHIAFKYTSTSTGAGNWYVKNVVVK